MRDRSRAARVLRHVIWLVGLFVVVASVTMVADHRFTTYGGVGPLWRWSEVAAAAALTASGTAVARAHRRLGLAAATTGVLWLVPEWAGWTAGPDWLRTVALASSGAALAMALLVVTSAAGLPRRATTVVARAAVVGAALSSAAHVLLLDPFREPWCWRSCRPNALAIDGSHGLGRIIEAVAVTTLVLGALYVIGASSWRWWRDRALKVSSWTALGAVAMVAGLAAGAALRLLLPEDPRSTAFAAPFLVANSGAVALAVGLCVDRWHEWRLAAELFRVVKDVRAAPPGSLESVLARTVVDPSLRLVYWSATHDGYVDASGRPAALPAGPERVTAIVRNGQPVAALSHRSAIDGSRIERAIGPAVRLSLENEQLRAATLAELAELKASRTRIVERADAERRRLERDLHDGAQQRIVGIALLLRTLRRRLTDDERSAGLALLTRAETLIANALDDLRRLAVGIHSAALSDGGLGAAVADLAESSSDLAVRVEAMPDGRQPSGVEAAAYLVVAEAIADARRRAATTLSLSAHQDDDLLVVELVDDAPPGTDGYVLAALDDRIGSLDGRLSMSSDDGRGTRLRLELPCGS